MIYILFVDRPHVDVSTTSSNRQEQMGNNSSHQSLLIPNNVFNHNHNHIFICLFVLKTALTFLRHPLRNLFSSLLTTRARDLRQSYNVYSMSSTRELHNHSREKKDSTLIGWDWNQVNIIPRSEEAMGYLVLQEEDLDHIICIHYCKIVMIYPVNSIHQSINIPSLVL